MKYPVMETFASVQGEGTFTGWPAYFIRLGGCDVGCVWCDVKDSWDAEKHPHVSAEDLAQEASESGLSIAIITGGEPAMYDLKELTEALKERSIRVHIETSGAHPLRGDFDWVTYSPKKFKAPLPEIAKLASELKVVVFNNSDFDWAETHAKDVEENCLLYLQPEWDKQKETTPMIFDYVKKNPQWKVSLQIHKYMGVD